MKAKTLFYNARIYTQAERLVVDSMAVCKNRVVAIGNGLEHDPDFKSYSKYNVRGKTIIPGLVDAHTHFYFFTLSLGRCDLHDIDSLDKCLAKIKAFNKKLNKSEWLLGEGYAPDRFKKREEPTKEMLDEIAGSRPAFFYSKDQHSAWVNSNALELAGITKRTKDPAGGKIERDANGNPTGILREGPAIGKVFQLISKPSETKINKLYLQALDIAYKNGVTGVHSVDSPEAFDYFITRAEKNKLGLRINYYFPFRVLDELKKEKIFYGMGDDFLRVAGIKIFSDGSLGSQTALCYNKYIGSKDNYGIEVASTKEMVKHIKKAASLGFPCAIHAIGDKAVSNVLDAFEQSPQMHFGARHRIEHLQLVRKKDLSRLKKLGVVVSAQPSHCPSDIEMVRNYWGKRGANAYIFNTLQKKEIPIAFGSDCPIEPLNPIHGIAAAVRRARPKSRDVFYPEERISAEDALYHYTVGSAYAVGQEHCRGYLLPGYPADFLILSDDITKVAPTKIYDVRILATVLDGKPVYSKLSL